MIDPIKSVFFSPGLPPKSRVILEVGVFSFLVSTVGGEQVIVFDAVGTLHPGWCDI
jgi:hypothetical protein